MLRDVAGSPARATSGWLLACVCFASRPPPTLHPKTASAFAHVRGGALFQAVGKAHPRYSGPNRFTSMTFHSLSSLERLSPKFPNPKTMARFVRLPTSPPARTMRYTAPLGRDGSSAMPLFRFCGSGRFRICLGLKELRISGEVQIFYSSSCVLAVSVHLPSHRPKPSGLEHEPSTKSRACSASCF